MNRLSLIFIEPSILNVPPRAVAPEPTVNVLSAVILTLSFNMVAPVTVNELSNTVAPLTSSVPLVCVLPVTAVIWNLSP